ncbi:MAG: sigma-70 family RNA polymerase sigma factor [Pseudomonadota bacterium]
MTARIRKARAPEKREESKSAQSSSEVEGTTDATTLTALYTDHAETLSRYLRSAFGDGPPDPDDAVQEAFRRISERQNLHEIRNLRAFLWRTARNFILTYKRNVDARSKYDFEIEHLFFASEGDSFSPERVLEVKEQFRIVNEALRKMPVARRKSFLWHRVDSVSFTEIGVRLGINRHAVVRHIAKASLEIETALEGKTERKE